MIKALFQRIESFEKESQQTYDLEHTVVMISKRLDSLEHEYYHSKAKQEENWRINELERIVACLLHRLGSVEQERNQNRATTISQ